MMLWPPYDGISLDYGFLWSVDGFCSIDIVYGD